ncbi:hypothetical protein [Mycolicibacterium baixiangningiae]|uniref:hypothetical protein n=1 Tax=Mycolicibacterium baixiangningiae TaxID=2761578 RepID=UPI001D002277|nr:hypothetical protein [Mycolicibacterium baixiangningiae]
MVVLSGRGNVVRDDRRRQRAGRPQRGRDHHVDLHTPDWFDRRRLELVRGITVDHIDLDRREVITRGGRRYPYWSLVLAPGATPVPLNVPGAGNALHLRSLAGASAAGFPTAWAKVPGFHCAIGEARLKYRGWGIPYEHSRLVDHRDGFTVWYEAGGEVIGVLSLNAADDHRLAAELIGHET